MAGVSSAGAAIPLVLRAAALRQELDGALKEANDAIEELKPNVNSEIEAVRSIVRKVFEGAAAVTESYENEVISSCIGCLSMCSLSETPPRQRIPPRLPPKALLPCPGSLRTSLMHYRFSAGRVRPAYPPPDGLLGRRKPSRLGPLRS